MSKMNVKRVNTTFNHEGVAAIPPKNALDELNRAVLSCLLWESQFYESGASIADRIKTLVAACKPADVASLAIKARTQYSLRHVPLLLVREMARKGGNLVGRTLTDVIQRADELSEFLSLYWADGKVPLSKQVKVGLAHAFQKFTPYQLAKYRGDDKAVKLRDVLFLCHAKPKDEAHAVIWKSLVDGTLTTPDTWEVALSGGADKKVTFERLIAEGKLGYFALLRNLRNMVDAKCDLNIVRAAITARQGGAEKILPFRFIAAARHAPALEPELDAAMQVTAAAMPKLSGVTAVLIDTSPSMAAKLSAKSDLSRMDAAFGLAILARELCESARVFAFSSHIAEVPARRGMALADAIKQAVPSNGTMLGAAIKAVNQVKYDRLIVVTDEESQDAVGGPTAKGYMINVSSAKNGIGYGDWTRITGFSEAILTYIMESERAVSP